MRKPIIALSISFVFLLTACSPAVPSRHQQLSFIVTSVQTNNAGDTILFGSAKTPIGKYEYDQIFVVGEIVNDSDKDLYRMTDVTCYLYDSDSQIIGITEGKKFSGADAKSSAVQTVTFTFPEGIDFSKYDLTKVTVEFEGIATYEYYDDSVPF